MANADKPSVAAREDYAANGGDFRADQTSTDANGTPGPFWGSSYENDWGGPVAASQITDAGGNMTDGTEAMHVQPPLVSDLTASCSAAA